MEFVLVSEQVLSEMCASSIDHKKTTNLQLIELIVKFVPVYYSRLQQWALDIGWLFLVYDAIAL